MQDSINERIRELVEIYSDKSSDFARAADLTSQNVYDLLTGRKGAPSYATLKKILVAFPTISERWLLLGEGEKYKKIEGLGNASLQTGDGGIPSASDAVPIGSLLSKDKNYTFLEVRQLLEAAYMQGLDNLWEASIVKGYPPNFIASLSAAAKEDSSYKEHETHAPAFRDFIEVSSNERQFLVAVSNITSVADSRPGPGSVINLQFSVDMHGNCIKTDLPLAKVKALIAKAQQD